MSDWLRDKDGAVLISVRVKPRSKKDEIGGLGPDGSLLVRLNAPPVDNKANQALTALVAKTLGAPKSAVSIHSGEKSRSKVVAAQGVEFEHARRALLRED